MVAKNVCCIACGKSSLSKNEIGITKKLLGMKSKNFYCLECLANLLEVEPQEIFFTSGGTESDNRAIKSSVLEFLSERPNIITSAVEHKAILNSCATMKKFGCTVTKLPVDKFGAVNLDDLREKIFHTDAVQVVGHIPVDVNELGVDMLSASAHKFNDPKGSGFLYVRTGLNISPYIDGGNQKFSRRAGTENVPAVAAMALALEKNCRDMNRTAKKISACEKILLDRLKNNGINFILNGGDNRPPGHLSLSFKDRDGETLLHRLDLKNICVSTGSACNSQQMQKSHVLQALAVPEAYVYGTIRITFGKENSLDEVETIAESLADILRDI